MTKMSKVASEDNKLTCDKELVTEVCIEENNTVTVEKTVTVRKSHLKKKRKNNYDPVEEARLERIVFGDPSDIIEKLPNESSEPSKKVRKSDTVIINTRDDSDSENETDKKSDTSEKDDTSLIEDEKKPAWIDEDDVQYTVNAALNAQNRKLPVERSEKTYSEYLQNKYKHIIGTPKWAETNKSDDPDADDLENEILKHSCHLEVPKSKKLPKNVIDIKALNAINKQTHSEGPIVSSLKFHPSSTVSLVAGSSGILSIFQVDGIENNKLTSMQFKKFPISKAEFLKDGTEILVGSQFQPFCHSYNLISGNTYKIPLPHGITNMKRYEVSPDGKIIALCGRLGEIYLLTTSSKELIGTLKMNAKCRAVAFTPDSRKLISHGGTLDSVPMLVSNGSLTNLIDITFPLFFATPADHNDMYVWDLNSRTCMHRASDDGCLACESIAISPSGQFLATGSKEGVVNIYDTMTVLEKRNPVPLKIVLNLVTAITALKFNPTSEILAMSSDRMNNAFKMVHLPSFTVFSNFPTFQTKIMMPYAIDFSPSSGYLGISNKSSSALLYRLKHYGNY